MNYFSDKELRCRCGCGIFGHDPDFVEVLNAVREQYGAPMILSSAYRCENHPIEAAKSAPGPHNTGKAVDVLAHGESALILIDAALAHGITGIGVKQHGDIDQRFVHLDKCGAAPNRPRPWIWSYK